MVIENKRENDCLVKYLYDEFRGDATKTYAIGIKQVDNYKGVYEWRHVNSAGNDEGTVKFTNWAAAEPKGDECIGMDVGEAATINGVWKGVACSAVVYGICEKVGGGSTVP